jgi:hypothetical protein
MKLFVAFDANGKILAATESKPGSLIQIRPDAMPGAQVEELELPTELHGKKPHELPPLQVDVVGHRLIQRN